MMTPSFIYRARNQRGKRIKGTIEADSIHQAVSRLREKGYLVTDIRAQRPGIGLGGGLPFRRGGSSGELALFCRQLATMSTAGLELAPTLRIIKEQHPNPRLRRAVSVLEGDLSGGSLLSEALGRQPRIFPPVLVHMVKAGETGGILDDVLDWMAHYFEREQRLQEKIRGALTYPGVVTLVSLAAVFFLVAFVLPSFTNLFLASGLSLPWPTRLLLGASQLISGSWYWLVGGTLLILLALYLYLQTEGGSLCKDRLLLTLPGVGSVLLQVDLARICRTTGTLLAAGVPLLTALSVVKNTAGNRVITQALKEVEVGVQKGLSPSDLFAANSIFPPMVVQMVTAGEKTGTLPRMLVQVSAYYEQEVDFILARFSSLLEPVLVLLVSGIVGFIVISIMLPLISLVTVLG